MLCRKPPRITLRFSSSAAARSVADNDDLLLEILLRLPIRSLIRFKSVSKRWLSLISDPDFRHRRSSFPPPTPSGIFLTRELSVSPKFDFVDFRPNPPRVSFESLKFSMPQHGILVFQSCNGLLLCCNDGRRYPKSHYYIYNPTTKHNTKLCINKTREIVGLNLVFDPLRSSCYKVICIRTLDYISYRIEIYSSDSCFWRHCNGSFSFPPGTPFRYGAYWNGAVHWIANNRETCIYLDLCDEKLHELPMPRAGSDQWEGRRVEYFGNCSGHLYWIESSEWQTVLNVYEIEDDRCGWFSKYRVDLHMVSRLFPKRPPAPEPSLELSKLTVLAFVDRSEVDEEPYVVLQGPERLAVRVNVKSGSFERSRILLPQFVAVGSYDQMLSVTNHLPWKTVTVRGPSCTATFKEVDEPLQLNMSRIISQ